MRKELKKLGSEDRYEFIGTFDRLGVKNGYKGVETTVLLTNIVLKETGDLITDHLWFNFTKGFANADLKQGDKVSFSARVSRYEKGYKGYKEDVYCPVETDYKLSYPSKVKKMG